MKLVTVREAADFLRISYRTAQRYLAEGRIPYTKPAGRVLIKEQDYFALCVIYDLPK